MILNNRNNNPVAAPAIANSIMTLLDYQAFTENNDVTLDDLYTLMITPGPERDRFVGTLVPTITFRRNKYYTQTY